MNENISELREKKIKELGQFLSELFPNDLVYITSGLYPRGSREVTQVKEHMGYYLSHTSEGRYCINVVLEHHLRDICPTVSNKLEDIEFSSDEVTEPEILGFGTLEKLVIQDYQV